MINKKLMITAAIPILIALGAAAYLAAAPAGTINKLENIHGIPYPQIGNALQITEPLAHADIYLGTPVLAREITLQVSFIPRETKDLSVGIRENSFWLSYPRYNIYRQDNAAPSDISGQAITRSVTIPLTDKLADQDRSLDLMFFADGPGITWWEVSRITYHITPALPTKSQLKDYIRSVLTREVPL